MENRDGKESESEGFVGKLIDLTLSFFYKKGKTISPQVKSVVADAISFDPEVDTVSQKPTDIFRNPLLWYPCILLAVWDAMTTMAGTLAILGGAYIGPIIAAILITSFVSAILFSSFRMLQVDKSTPLGVFMRVLFFIAIFYDMYTSYYGAKFTTFVGTSGQTNLTGYSISFSKWIVVFLLTFMSVSATMICSWVYYEKSKTPTIKR